MGLGDFKFKRENRDEQEKKKLRQLEESKLKAEKDKANLIQTYYDLYKSKVSEAYKAASEELKGEFIPYYDKALEKSQFSYSGQLQLTPEFESKIKFLQIRTIFEPERKLITVTAIAPDQQDREFKKHIPGFQDTIEKFIELDLEDLFSKILDTVFLDDSTPERARLPKF